jgi:SpoVK/Ycf46/Vps4 family AAA+-type ATPase
LIALCTLLLLLSIAVCRCINLARRYVPPARSRQALKAILEAATRKFEWGADVDLDAVVEQLRDGCTGADVAGVASAAWMKAARRKVACCCDSPQQGNHSVIVEQQDLIAAAACAVPSLSTADLERFDRLHSSFSVGGGGK